MEGDEGSKGDDSEEGGSSASSEDDEATISALPIRYVMELTSPCSSDTNLCRPLLTDFFRRDVDDWVLQPSG